MPYRINQKCTSCGACAPECPTDSIMAGVGRFVIDTDTCLDHAKCVAVCPVDAIVRMSLGAVGDLPKESSKEKR